MAAPLVSIVTRTLGRPCLVDAAASVAAQTWRPIEWVVVDAAGTGLVPPPTGDVVVRVVSTGERMLRSPALNAGLDGATGSRALILDDDDLLLPHAVARLSAALDAAPAHRLAYGDVEVESGGSAPIKYYRTEYSDLRLAKRNLFPPNAALFDLPWLREHGIRVDDTLDWFEDWDFWLSVSERTRFLHVQEVTAIYRASLSQSGILEAGLPSADPRIREHGQRVARRFGRRRALLQRAHDELKAAARGHEAAGRWPEAAAAWAVAHLNFHYDPEPILRYAAIARRAGDLPTARATLVLGHHLLPNDAELALAIEGFDTGITGEADPPGDAAAALGPAAQRQS